jgi:hypothetical protein
LTHFSFELAKFNKWLLDQPSQDYTLFVTQKDDRKIERWAAELAYPFLSVPPKEILYYSGEANGGKSIFDAHYNLGDQFPTMVILDDASYSGLQMTETTSNLFRSTITNFVWIVPFMSERAQHKMANHYIVEKKITPKTDNTLKSIFSMNLFTKKQNNPEIKSKEYDTIFRGKLLIFTNTKIPMLKDCLSPKECKRLPKEWDCENSPIYFDHKHPDTLSGFPMTYEFGKLLENSDKRTYRNKRRLTQGPVESPYK